MFKRIEDIWKIKNCAPIGKRGTILSLSFNNYKITEVFLIYLCAMQRLHKSQTHDVKLRDGFL